MDTHEQRLAAYEVQLREKYSDKDRQAMAKSGEAMPDGSYPITDREDLSNAIHAVGRGGADHDAIRKHIIARAKALGASDEIPDNWGADGSLKGENSGSPTPNEARESEGIAEQKPRNPATPKRAFSSLVEQPPAQSGEFQVRMASDETIAHFVGYASTTGVPYSVRDWLGEYNETIMPGAFAKTLREQGDIPLLFNHDGVPLASTSSGTSRLSEDSVGLRNEAELDRRDALTNSICVQLQRKVLGKMSFSFRAVKETWNDEYDDRGVTEAALYDSSIVTYPANPTTSGELVDAMRSALGREGRSLWLADTEMSVRSALPAISGRGASPEGDEADLLERALRALVHADEVVCRAHGPHGRARTFHVVTALLSLRAGKVLSSANQSLLESALTALAQADKALDKVDAALDQGQEAISTVLNVANPDTDDSDSDGSDGKSSNQGAGNGNPIMPQDGAGPRSASLRLRRTREAELRALRRH